MAKIGIISSFSYMEREINYGSLFQYYALQEYLKEIGHDSYWIRYYGNKLSSYLKNLTNIGFTSETGLSKSKRECRRFFKNFIRNNIELSKNIFFAHTKLINLIPPKADYYITGSDKVWGKDTVTYLDFVPENKKKYSYAASCPEYYTDFGNKEAELLKRFDGISIRERTTLEMFRKIGDFDPIQVADPTLLLSKAHYLRFTTNIKTEKDPYILSYLGSISNSSQNFSKAIHTFSNNMTEDLIIVPIENRGVEAFFPDELILWPSPEKWLSLFSRANYILTDSYHGTIFSVIMQKPFLSIIPKDRPSRPIQSFLEEIGLTERIIQNKEIDLTEKMTQSIDWNKTKILLDSLITHSKNFLKTIR